MKKTSKSLLAAFCLLSLAGCQLPTNSTPSSSNTSSPAVTNTASSSSTMNSSSSSSSSSSTITPSDAAAALKVVANSIEANNSGEAFVGPQKVWNTYTEYMDYEATGEESFAMEVISHNAYDSTTGYVYSGAIMDGELYMETYSYAKDSTYYLAMNEMGDKYYVSVPCTSNEEAQALAVAMLPDLGIVDIVAPDIKGIASLQAVANFMDQFIANNDDDPSNNVTNDYDVYDLTIESTIIDEDSYDATINLNANAHMEDDTMLYDSSIEGVLKSTFENSYMVYALDQATVSETYIEGDVEMTMIAHTKVESLNKYEFDAIYPNLDEYSYMELQ